MDRSELEAMLCDARYGLRQCRDHDCADRAGDALERIVERLERTLAEFPALTPVQTPMGWLSTA